MCARYYRDKAVTWLWPNRFAIKRLGIIAGLPDVRAKFIPTVAASFEQGGDAANVKEPCLKVTGQGAAAQIESVCADLADSHVGRDRVDQDQLHASEIDDTFGGPNFIATMVTAGGPWPSTKAGRR